MSLSKHMMAICRRTVLVAIAGFVVAIPSLQAAPVSAGKVGVVDIQNIFQQMPEAKQADATLKATAAPFRKEFDRQQAELQKEAGAFSSEGPSMSKQARALKVKDLNLKSQALQEYQQEKMALMSAKRKELYTYVQKKLEAAVKTVADREGYSLVLDRQAMVYGASDDDLTIRVMSQLGIKP